MTPPIPAWWPEIVREADKRRHVTGLYLAHATPALVDGTLRLTFRDAEIARAWEESRAQAALEGALKALRIDVGVQAYGPAVVR